MGKILIIGCGGVASVAIQKCCQVSEVFTEMCIASRTVSKCEALKEKLEGKTNTKITTAQVDADNVAKNGGKSMIAIKNPLNTPIKTPTPIHAMIATGTDAPLCTIKNPPINA